MLLKNGFALLLVGAVLLECAGYMAFPFMALRLRDHFQLSLLTVGFALSAAIWVRPLSALVGGYLADFVKGQWLLVAACVLESCCFLSLGLGTSSAVAVVGLILGNIGFSLWAPNLFALAAGIGEPSGQVKRFSLLTGAINAGAAFGCVLGGVIVAANPQVIFVLAGALYLLIIPILFPILSKLESERKNQTVDAPEKAKFKVVAPLILVSVFYWAMYGQFNSYFVLYSNDWLKNTAVAGVAFALLALSVSLFSYAFGKLGNPKLYLRKLFLLSLGLVAIGWLGLSTFMGLSSAIVFILALGLSETFVSIFLAEGWSHAFVTTNSKAQAYNFSIRNLGMGLGGLLGGFAYIAPADGHALLQWTGLNAALVIAGFLVVLAGAR